MKTVKNSEKSLVLRVLIVEDQPERQKQLCALFRDHAWIVVHTAERANRLLLAYPFDLVCLDYDLAGPGKGDAVARTIRDLEPPKPRVLIHSMSAPGAERIRTVLPDAQWVPIATLMKSNARIKKIRARLRRGLPKDWKTDNFMPSRPH